MDCLPRSTRRNLLQTFDGPCSALALNCCQFSCCIPRDAFTNYDLDSAPQPQQHADWMKQVLTARPSLKLRELVIPGTHDSGSYSIPATTLFSAVGRTQNIAVLEQLKRGARYVDIRVGGGGNDATSLIWHGCLAGSPFSKIVDQIATFLHQHEGEFVIVEIVAEYGRPFTPTQKIQCLEVVKQSLGDLIYATRNLQRLLHETPLATVIQQQKKQCLVLVHSRFYDGLEQDVNGIIYNEEYIESNYGFFRSDQWMNNRWYNTRDITQLFQWNLQEVGEAAQNSSSDKSRLLLQNQLILTPGAGSPFDIVQLLVGQLSLRPVSFALQLYQGNRLEDYFRQHSDQPWNMIMLDFIDLVPGLVAFLISLNYQPAAGPAVATRPEQHHLQIRLAAAHDGKQGSKSQDVTAKMQALIHRDCVLYVTDVVRDLGVSFGIGQLTLVYRYGSAAVWHVKLISFDASTQILLSPYAQNPGLVVDVGSKADDQEKTLHNECGVIFDGQHQAANDKVKTPNTCCVVQYRVLGDSNEIEFSLLN